MPELTELRCSSAIALLREPEQEDGGEGHFVLLRPDSEGWWLIDPPLPSPFLSTLEPLADRWAGVVCAIEADGLPSSKSRVGWLIAAGLFVIGAAVLCVRSLRRPSLSAAALAMAGALFLLGGCGGPGSPGGSLSLLSGLLFDDLVQGGAGRTIRVHASGAALVDREPTVEVLPCPVVDAQWVSQWDRSERAPGAWTRDLALRLTNMQNADASAECLLALRDEGVQVEKVVDVRVDQKRRLE